MAKKIRNIYRRVKTEEDWNEVLATLKISKKYGEKQVDLTREDLCIIGYLMEEAQNRANYGECNLIMGEIANTWMKIHNMFVI